MKTSFKLPLALVLAAALAAPALGAPGPSLTTSLGNIQFSAIDLTPGDASNASYRLANEEISFRSSLVLFQDNAPKYELSNLLAPGEAADNTFAHGPFTVVQSTSGAIGAVHSSITWGRDIPLEPYGASMFTAYSYSASLTLSAGSAIIVSGHLEQQFMPAGMNDQNEAASSLGIFLSAADPSINSSASLMADHRFPGDAWEDDADGWDDVSDFGVTLTNNGTTDMTIDVRLFFNSSLLAWQPLASEVSPPVSAVPEPASYAMLGAGLALLSGMARRRRA